MSAKVNAKKKILQAFFAARNKLNFKLFFEL
jgi:hypothetical protein